MKLAGLQGVVVDQRCLSVRLVQIHKNDVNCDIRRHKYHSLVITAAVFSSNKVRSVSGCATNKVLREIFGQGVKRQHVCQIGLISEEICVEILSHVFEGQCLGPDAEFIDVAVEKTFGDIV